MNAGLEPITTENWMLWLIAGSISLAIIAGIIWAGWYAWNNFLNRDQPTPCGDDPTQY